MKKIISLLLIVFFLAYEISAQTVQMETFINSFTVSNTQVGVRIRSTTVNQPYIGVTFYFLYQSSGAAFVSYDDSKLIAGWGTENKTTANASITQNAGGRTYDRRLIYANSDQNYDGLGVPTAGTRMLTTAWDTVLLINFTNILPTPPEGGYFYTQRSAESPNIALTDLFFANMQINVTLGQLALQSPTLPVRLSSFDAQCLANKTASITWSTSQETNSGYFEIEKSSDGVSWTSLGRVNAAGSSTALRNYQFTDSKGGAAQYRLKQVDRDGRVTYSSTVRTTCEGRNVFVTLYPVPAKDVVTLVVGADRAVKTNLQVFDNKGRMVINMPVTLTNGTNNFKIPVHNLTAGEYILRGTDPGIEISKRFTVIR